MSPNARSLEEVERAYGRRYLQRSGGHYIVGEKLRGNDEEAKAALRTALGNAARRQQTASWVLDPVVGRVASMSVGVKRFPFRFDPAYRGVARLFGITPNRAWVDIGDRELEARFGPWRVRTDIGNILGAEITGPYTFLKTAGPARLAVTDRGLTFASNRDCGVLITFRTPVPGLDPVGLLRHPELTVTVADVDGLAALLRARTVC